MTTEADDNEKEIDIENELEGYSGDCQIKFSKMATPPLGHFLGLHICWCRRGL